MSTLDAVMLLVATWTACAVLSARSFIPMLYDAERRTGRSVTGAQYALTLLFWPLVWVIVAINTFRSIGRGEEE